ncbi:MAG TPA: hypothetical protein VLX92_08085 [Kofleriaceae bacterium]|nr:hypothetical protein [Kofleriaceae bacterium]
MRWAIAWVAIAACGKSGGGSGSGSSAGSPRDALIAAWKANGLDASAFTAASTPVGKDCATGTVSKLDVLVCAFDSPDAAQKAADAGLQWVGDTTGGSQAHGTFVIAVADRHKVDPSGKTINQIFKLAK